MSAIDVDVLIFGGGVAGLWTLDAAVRAGRSGLLVETEALGAGQTIWSQGIIHGGLKYTLDGLMNPSAEAIREMPAIWRGCLDGSREPRLTDTRLRSPHCYLWRTQSLTSRLGMIGARVGLRVAPVTLDAGERPPALRAVPGTVARLDEPVIDTASLLSDLASRHALRLMKVDPAAVRFDVRTPGVVSAANLGVSDIRPRHVVFCAGNGTRRLRELARLPAAAMQVRPLHMVMVRGHPADLPELNGHCVDGNRTRVTITTAEGRAGHRVWQVGGEIAERGATMTAPDLIDAARRELHECLPGLDLSRCELATYQAPRAEGTTPGGRRPEDCTVLREGNVITAWPTKLALAPRLADLVLSRLDEPAAMTVDGIEAPRPAVALPPWETSADWVPGGPA